MKAQKVMLSINMEGLSIDIARGMIADVLAQIDNGNESGMLRSNDGDEIRWDTTRKDVEF